MLTVNELIHACHKKKKKNCKTLTSMLHWEKFSSFKLPKASPVYFIVIASGIYWLKLLI